MVDGVKLNIIHRLSCWRSFHSQLFLQIYTQFGAFLLCFILNMRGSSILTMFFFSTSCCIGVGHQVVMTNFMIKEDESMNVLTYTGSCSHVTIRSIFSTHKKTICGNRKSFFFSIFNTINRLKGHQLKKFKNYLHKI